MYKYFMLAILTVISVSCIIMPYGLTDRPSNASIVEFEKDTKISVIVSMRSLYSFGDELDLELLELIKNNKVNLYYDGTLNGLGKIVNENSFLEITFGKLPDDLKKEGNWVYATFVLSALFHMYKEDPECILKAYLLINWIYSDPNYSLMLIPELLYKGLVGIKNDKLDKYVNDTFEIKGNSILLK